MTKKKKDEIVKVFALICDNLGNGNQSKKHGVNFGKIQNTKVEVM